MADTPSPEKQIEDLRAEVADLRGQLAAVAEQRKGAGARADQAISALRENDRVLRDWAAIVSMACPDGRCLACGVVTKEGENVPPSQHKLGCLGLRTKQVRDVNAAWLS